ncbi:ATP-binding protein [Streptomyces sp. NPDC091292]|uniref:ATP-binding protein n=1 Tax=Streptomyces sp. NPDC091292 TaxID=3365991 RepID=UPI0037F3E8B2
MTARTSKRSKRVALLANAQAAPTVRTAAPAAVVQSTGPDEMCPGLRNLSVKGFEIILDRTTGPGDSLSDEDRSRPRQVRRIERAHLRHWGIESLIEAADLLVTELVTNAFAHGRGPVAVRMWRTATHLWLVVGGSSVIQLNESQIKTPGDGGLAETGRGLGLVDAVADSWGLSDERTRLWCALQIPGSG